MTSKEFYEEAIELGYTKKEVVEMISLIESFEEQGLKASYRTMLAAHATIETD